MRKERRGINGKTEKRAEFALRILLDILIVALLLVIGRVAYTGAYSVFRNRSMEDPPGREVSVVIPDPPDAYTCAAILKDAGLIENALIFVITERISGYHGREKAGTYDLSTAMTPEQILAVLSGDAG